MLPPTSTVPSSIPLTFERPFYLFLHASRAALLWTIFSFPLLFMCAEYGGSSTHPNASLVQVIMALR
jgi:hypothetical protein